MPTSDEFAMMNALQSIVHDAISRVPYSAASVAAGAMDDWSRLYNYTLGVGEPVTMKDLMEGELYTNMGRVFAGLKGFYGADAAPETIYHFFGNNESGALARKFYSDYSKDKKDFLSNPVYPPMLDLNREELQKEIRQRLASGVSADVSGGLSRIPRHALYRQTVIRDQWRLTRDKIWTLPFPDLKAEIFDNTPLELKGDWMPAEQVFIGLKEQDLLFYFALGSDMLSLSLKREYEEWRKAKSP